ncbi:hypothetical protein [Endozoicomonas sp.]|uniref:hypothetical protein n=1 Tax=Endozoicomonas sp. TaxID=1892382 RepID=UPI003AF52E71
MGGVIGSLGHAGDAQNRVARPENVESEEGRAGHRHVIKKHVPNSMSSSSDSSRLARAGVLFLAGISGVSAVAVAPPNTGDIVNCNMIQNNDFVMKQIEKNEQCNVQLRKFEGDARVCQARFEDKSYNKLETMDQRKVSEYCTQAVKQNATAGHLVCQHQVDVNNDLQSKLHQAQEQYQDLVANCTAENTALQEQHQEQVANLTARIALLQKQIQEMKNKQTTVQLTVAQASAAASGIGLSMLGVGAGITKLCCSGKSKDKKETVEPGQSSQPVQVLHQSEPYAVIPMEVVSVEVCEDDHRSGDRRRLHG